MTAVESRYFLRINGHPRPSSYIGQQQFSFAKGDAIEVVGSRVTIADKEALIAREITKDGKTLWFCVIPKAFPSPVADAVTTDTATLKELSGSGLLPMGRNESVQRCLVSAN